MKDEETIIRGLREEISVLNQISDKFEAIDHSLAGNDLAAVATLQAAIDGLFESITGKSCVRIKLAEKLNCAETWRDIIRNLKQGNLPEISELISAYTVISRRVSELSSAIQTRIEQVKGQLSSLDVSRTMNQRYHSLSRVPKTSIFIDKTK